MKRTIKILIIPLILIIVLIIYTLYLINKNEKYLELTNKNIKENYLLNEEITYSNQYNNYYIFTTQTKVIVLNNEYEEVLKENIKNIMPIPEGKELIYKTKKLIFEETSIKDNNLIYKYYDAITGDLIKETIMEKK